MGVCHQRGILAPRMTLRGARAQTRLGTKTMNLQGGSNYLAQSMK